MTRNIEIIKNRYVFLIEFIKDDEPAFIFKFQQSGIEYSFEENVNIVKEYVTSEKDFLRIGELIDALKYSDVIHPINRDIQISPFGMENKHFLHIKWQGWNTEHLINKYPQIEKITSTAQREILVELNNMKNHIDKYLRTVNEQVKPETFYRKMLHLLINTVTTMLPDSLWGVRGFLPTPFRVIEIKKYSDTTPIFIRLTPFETRKVIRFLERYYQYLLD